jgi:hypothetical protein
MEGDKTMGHPYRHPRVGVSNFTCLSRLPRTNTDTYYTLDVQSCMTDHKIGKT